MRAIFELIRWKEHVPYSIPLTVIGAIIAASTGALLDHRLLFILIANVLSMSYAFMINDIEDAEDDARDSHKAKRNPICAGKISISASYNASRIIALLALAFYAFTNHVTLGLGIITLLLSHLYSWRKVRLKAYPVTDILSHSLMLSGLLIVSGFTTFSFALREIWALAAAATLFSVYGQIYNQIRDYDVDKKSKIKNTTIMVGIKRAHFLKNASVLMAVIALLAALYFETFPLWLIAPAALSAPFVFSLKTTKDSSGAIAVDLTGRLQMQMLLFFNIVVLVWLLAVSLQVL